ncbi:hypothetical protein LJR084_002457 [Variovorax sp. LjRoot84]|uniref:hypothetical protein n=1 Tax=Variovorax sp. LjRoot84 TaxID=3342340 RepID=UPI003ED006FA
MTASTYPALASLIETRQNQLGITDAELATALGYTDARVVSMLKVEKMTLPINKVPTLATTLKVDACMVLRLVMEEKSPGLLEIIEKVLNPFELKPHEINLIEHCRKLAGDRRVAPIVIEGKFVITLVTTS